MNLSILTSPVSKTCFVLKKKWNIINRKYAFCFPEFFSSTLSYLRKNLTTNYPHTHSAAMQWAMRCKWWQIIFICLIESTQPRWQGSLLPVSYGVRENLWTRLESTQCGRNKNSERLFLDIDFSSPVNWKWNFTSGTKPRDCKKDGRLVRIVTSLQENLFCGNQRKKFKFIDSQITVKVFVMTLCTDILSSKQ